MVRSFWPGLRIATAVLVVLFLAGIVEGPFLTFYRISGNSMRPAFLDGDRVLVTTRPQLAGGIDFGDAVIAEHEGETLIKRVVGLPGDRIEFRAGILWRNGEPAEGPAPRGERDAFCSAPFTLGSDEFFLAGDNRRVSVDSRLFGPVLRRDIVGEVVWRIQGGEGASATAAER